jgi:hypothetical protein
MSNNFIIHICAFKYPIFLNMFYLLISELWGCRNGLCNSRFILNHSVSHTIKLTKVRGTKEKLAVFKQEETNKEKC